MLCSISYKLSLLTSESNNLSDTLGNSLFSDNGETACMTIPDHMTEDSMQNREKQDG